MIGLVLAALLTLFPGDAPPDPQPGTVLGAGVPLQLTPATEFPLADSATWHNWHTDACHQPNYWPMVYSRSDIERHPLPANCADSPLLFLNERNATVEDAAALLYEYRAHPGGLWCCGTLFYMDDLWYTLAVLGTYWQTYGAPPPLDGLHIHVYTQAGLEDTVIHSLYPWRRLADLLGYRIAVTEYACLGQDAAAIARCLPRFTQILIDALGPKVLFWFAWRYDKFYPATNLVDADGEYTVVGKAWMQQANIAGAGYTLYAPGMVR